MFEYKSCSVINDPHKNTIQLLSISNDDKQPKTRTIKECTQSHHMLQIVDEHLDESSQ
jgi:hypothetical protein